MVPVVFGLTLLVFLLIHLVPGDPARTMLGPRPPQAVVDALRQEWGLDRPLVEQFLLFVTRLLQGDLGVSLASGVPAGDLISDRVPPTLALVLVGTVFTLLISVPLATLAAVNLNRWPDHVIRAVPLLGLGMPSFWVAIILILALALTTGWFPAGGYGSNLPEQFHALVLPGLTIAIALTPITIRSLRAALLEVLDADYIATARSKGLTEGRVLFFHAVRNAIIPTITVLGVNIGWLIGNTLIVEKIFAIPGIGALMVDAILERDFPIVQALALIFGVLVVLVNVLADVTRSLLDPRLKLT